MIYTVKNQQNVGTYSIIYMNWSYMDDVGMVPAGM